jgi:hypothetical protein
MAIFSGKVNGMHGPRVRVQRFISSGHGLGGDANPTYHFITMRFRKAAARLDSVSVKVGIDPTEVNLPDAPLRLITPDGPEGFVKLRGATPIPDGKISFDEGG